MYSLYQNPVIILKILFIKLMNEFIYHYTSIETLALILKNKNIRFNSIKNVDDINETEFSDENGLNFSHHTLISCWTDNEDENLAFWNMYTPNMQGVRIKLPRSIFKIYEFYSSEDLFMQPGTLIRNSLLRKEECFTKDYWIIPFTTHFFKVQYTDDEKLLKPQIFHINDDIYTFKAGNIGLYKSKTWAFQNEVRFKLFVLPARDKYGNSFNPLNNFMKIIEDKLESPLDEFYLPICEDIFSKMEITLGPKSNYSQELIVNALIEKYNPSALLNKNRLSGLIK